MQTYILLHSIKFFGLHQLFGIHTVGCTSHALFMLFSHNGYIENQSGSCRCQRLYSLGFLVVLLDLEGLLLPDNEKTASAKGQLLYACLKLHYITSLQYAFGHSACVWACQPCDACGVTHPQPWFPIFSIQSFDTRGALQLQIHSVIQRNVYIGMGDT